MSASIPLDSVLAADIGGTLMRAALVDRSGVIRGRDTCPTEPQLGLEDAALRLAELLRRAAQGAEPAGVGVSTAGPLDPETGTYRDPPNLFGWDGLSMKPHLEKVLGLPVWVGHDATLAALAETQFGAGQGAQHLLYVTVSTGIGGGIVCNGSIVTGAHGGAGEVGHITVQRGGPSCNAGCDGCLEGTASGTAIAAAAQRRVTAGEASSMAAEGTKIDSRAVFEAAEAGDRLALEVIDEAIDNLGAGLGGLLNIFDPEVLVLGGGVIDGLQPYWDRVLSSIQSHALSRYRDGVPVQVSPLGADVGLLGAAEHAFRKLERAQA